MNEPSTEPSLCEERGFDSVRCLLVDLAQQRTVDSVLELSVRRLSELNDVALVRIWLMDDGDLCQECLFQSECPDRRRCLHLVASAGRSQVSDQQWNRLDGRFRRFPLGVGKVGQIASTGESVELTILDTQTSWLADSEWAERETIRGVIGHPLDHRGEIQGVMMVFLRRSPPEDAMMWLRMVADHAASAIANSRAFEEIERLRGQLALENEYLRDEIKAARAYGEIIGQSPALRKVMDQVELVARTDTTVLVLGESGVGKELVARAIHEQSPRKDRALIRVNCASIPRELFESEFFGHVQGAFTGAIRDRDGRFAMADGGTLFLDEVGEIPLDVQGKLLRVLQEKTYERIGDENSRTVDVRIVAATNRDLRSEVKARQFREDLYYRLSVFPIEVAPLRERREDISLLFEHFVQQHRRELGIAAQRPTRQQLSRLERYSWPGNIRELQNLAQRAVIRSRGGPLQIDLPSGETESPPVSSPASSGRESPRSSPLTEAEFRMLERENLQAVLELTGGKVSGAGGAAEYLGIHPATLTSRLKAMGISRSTGMRTTPGGLQTD